MNGLMKEYLSPLLKLILKRKEKFSNNNNIINSLLNKLLNKLDQV